MGFFSASFIKVSQQCQIKCERPIFLGDSHSCDAMTRCGWLSSSQFWPGQPCHYDKKVGILSLCTKNTGRPTLMMLL